MKEHCDWIRIGWRNVYPRPGKNHIISKISNVMIAPSLNIPMQDNYIITSSMLKADQLSKLDFTIFVHMKALKRVKFEELKGYELKPMVEKFQQPLNIKELTLRIWDLSGLELEALDGMINLQEVTSLEVDVRQKQKQVPFEQFQWLFENLPNLKHLSLVPGTTEYYGACFH